VPPEGPIIVVTGIEKTYPEHDSTTVLQSYKLVIGIGRSNSSMLMAPYNIEISGYKNPERIPMPPMPLCQSLSTPTYSDKNQQGFHVFTPFGIALLFQPSTFSAKQVGTDG